LRQLVTRKAKNYTIINNQLKLLRVQIDNFIIELKTKRERLTPHEFKEHVLDILGHDRQKNDVDNDIEDSKSLSLPEDFKQWIEKRNNSEKHSESTIEKYRMSYRKFYQSERNKRLILKYEKQKYNQYLKEIAKLAGIDKPVEISRPKGNKNVVQVLPKYKMMSNNMVRQSGITGLLRKKVSPKMVMQISGHKKLAVFERYIRMEEQESPEAVRNAWDG
jgi:hypothetical protein